MTEKATLQKLRAMENKLGTLEEGQKSLIEGHQASMEQITMNNNNNYSSLKQEVIALKNSMADLVEMMKAQLQTKQKVDVAEESLKFKDNNSELVNTSIQTPIQNLNSTFKGKGMDSVEKEKIVLHALTTDAEGCSYSEIYTIDMRKGQVSKCPYALLVDSFSSTMVCLGSVIYVMGSRIGPHSCKTKPPHSQCTTNKGHYHKHVSYLDLDNDTVDGWKEGPCPSDGPSTNPVVIEFGGKIYLFHCRVQSKLAHVFDPLSNKWETLLPPPSVDMFDLHYTGSALPDPPNNRILVHFQSINSVFAYYPANNQWELVLKHMAWTSIQIFADGVIFAYLPEDPEFLMAYHVATTQWLNIVYTSEFPDHAMRIGFKALLHLGSNLMCLAAYSYDYSPPKTQTQTRVYLAKFRFEHSPHNPTDLLITPLPEESYTTGARSLVHRFFPI